MILFNLSTIIILAYLIADDTLINNNFNKQFMSTRTKKTMITDSITMDEAAGIMADYAKIDASIRKMNAEQDIAIAKIREKNQDKLAKLGNEKKEAVEKLEYFARNSPELFTKRKSFEFAHGIIGMRTGTPALKILKGFTWASVLNMTKSLLPEYIRMKEEIDKERMIMDRELEDVLQKMKECGVQVVQEESFYVDAKIEEFAS